VVLRAEGRGSDAVELGSVVAHKLLRQSGGDGLLGWAPAEEESGTR
jgi:hypothetical protein